MAQIDHEGGGLKWMQLVEILRQEIAGMRKGQILPSTRTLMQTYEISDGTVNHALSVLREEGLIVTYKGRGSFVA